MADPLPAKDTEILGRIDASHFVAGVVAENGTIVRAAPIVHYMVGWSQPRVRQYCARKGWRLRGVRVHG